MDTHEAIWMPDMFDTGMGTVVAARIKDGGRKAIVGVFIVDLACLGVKNAMYESCPVDAYRERIRGFYEAEFTMEPVAPACARRLVEEAMAYAQSLGFPPHLDTTKALRAFEGVAARDCTRSFTFGRDGKPFYVRGPHESDLQARQIIRQLERRCGAGNFHYLVDINPDF
ncbi:MAG: hypothetical protein ACKO3N_20480 [Verrucomicrobiota bacterium]